MVSAVIAKEWGADKFIILTGVLQDTHTASYPSNIRCEEVEAHLQAGQLPSESMKHKVEVALKHLASGGKETIITSINQLGKVVKFADGAAIYV